MVTLNLDSAQQGNDIVAEGLAELVSDGAVDAAKEPAFVAKYTPLLSAASTFEEWAAMFRSRSA